MQLEKKKGSPYRERSPQSCKHSETYKTHHSIKRLVKRTAAIALALLVIGIPGGMEQGTIALIPGFIETLACLGGLYLLGRPYMIRSYHA